jgi:hypothetical protein
VREGACLAHYQRDQQQSIINLPAAGIGGKLMNAVSLCCSKCGAPLSIPQSVNFVTCSYCGASLAVKSSGGVVYTEVLNRIGDNTDQMVQELHQMRVQNSFLALDNTWQMNKQDWTALLSNKRREIEVLTTKIDHMLAQKKGFDARTVVRQRKKLEEDYEALSQQYYQAERQYLFDRYLLQNNILTVAALDSDWWPRKQATEANLAAWQQHLAKLKAQSSGFGNRALKKEYKRLLEEFERLRAEHAEAERMYLQKRYILQNS